MRIMIAYPGYTWSPFDVATGYENALKRAGHDVLRFDYHTRLDFYSVALAHFAEINRSFHRKHGDVAVLASESIILKAIEFVPDVVLIINGMNLHRRGYDLLYRLHLPVVLLLTESPYLDDWQIKIADKGHAAGVLTNDLSSVEHISDVVDVPVSYLPHSYDTERHRPRPKNDAFKTDVFFWGTLWPERQEILRPLAALMDDYDVLIGGTNPAADEIEAEDIMANNELAIRYAQTKIAVNHHRTIISHGDGKEQHIKNGEAWSLGPRAFEIAACGAFQLSDGTRPELTQVFNGSVPTYRDGQELLDMTKYYLSHNSEREELAAAAHEAVKGCSFDDRVRDIVDPFLMEVTNGSTI